MKRAILATILAISIISCFAFAPDAPGETAAPAAPTIKLEVTVAEYQLIQKSIQKAPFEESANLVFKLDAQARKELSDTTKKK